MKPAHLIQEWLADRFSWVQYPNLRPADEITKYASRTGLRFKTAMQLGKRIDLTLLSLLLFIAGTAAVSFVALLAYLLL